MALVLADRVKETTTTTGQGTVTLAGASTGFNSFSAVGDGNTTYYCIAGQGTNEWEVGIGTYTASGTTLSRDTVLSSSAGGTTKTTFSAGTKDVFVTYPAGKSIYVDSSGGSTINNLTVTGTFSAPGIGGNYALNSYDSPATWTKPAGLKAIKVTVVGAGGNGGSGGSTIGGGGGGGGGAAIEYIPAPSIPSPVSVTAGSGTNSFGAFCSATAGTAGTNNPGIAIVAGGSGGSGSGGNINIDGGGGGFGGRFNSAPTATQTAGSGAGGSSILGGGGASRGTPSGAGNNGGNYGGGGSGGVGSSGGTGAPGIVIVEEFY